MEKKITKFSIGRFTNGAYIVLGIIRHGVLRGIVIKTKYPNIYSKFSFVSLPEFHSEKEKYPQFKKKLNLIERFYAFFKDRWMATQMVYFLDEVSDLPLCAWRNKDLIDNRSRKVMIEKFDRRTIVLNFSKLNKESELEIVDIIANKYGKRVVKEVLNYKPVERPYDIWEDANENRCPVRIPTFYNDYIYVVFNNTSVVDVIFEIFVQRTHKDRGVDKDFEFIREMNK